MLGLILTCFILIVEIFSQPRILLPETDFYEVKERIVLTSDPFGDDYDWPYEEQEGVRFVGNKGFESKKESPVTQIDYEYFGDANSTRSKKQLVDANYTETNQMTEKNYPNDELQKNGSFNYTDNGKSDIGNKMLTKLDSEDETLSNWIFNPIEPEKCTKGVGFGLTALRCISSSTGSQRTSLILNFLLCWLIIDLAIIFLLWCTKGWCCCCCTFPFCKPEQRINETQRFLAYNPPGEWTDEQGKHHEYDPTADEKLIYEDMSRSFLII